MSYAHFNVNDHLRTFVCSKSKVLQFRSHPLDEQHCETSLMARYCSFGVLDPNIIHHDAACATEYVSNIFE